MHCHRHACALNPTFPLLQDQHYCISKADWPDAARCVQFGEQHALLSTDPACKRKCLFPWPVNEAQRNAFKASNKISCLWSLERLEHERGHARLLTACMQCRHPTAVGDDTQLAVCSKCSYARYCNRECQVADWPLHKLFRKGYMQHQTTWVKGQKRSKSLADATGWSRDMSFRLLPS